MAGRTVFPLRLSREARKGWEREAERHGVTLTALFEAVGLLLTEKQPTSGFVEEAVAKARSIDTERRKRR